MGRVVGIYTGGELSVPICYVRGHNLRENFADDSVGPLRQSICFRIIGAVLLVADVIPFG